MTQRVTQVREEQQFMLTLLAAGTVIQTRSTEQGRSQYRQHGYHAGETFLEPPRAEEDIDSRRHPPKIFLSRRIRSWRLYSFVALARFASRRVERRATYWTLTYFLRLCAATSAA